MIELATLLQGRYRIIRVLGRGGMGAVYQAEDQRLKVLVALKQTLRTDESFAHAFAREARILAALHHPAIPMVSDYFNQQEGHFLVMQFIPGADLATQLAQRTTPFPLDQMLRWADQLLDALHYLHRQDPPVIHRDIKPHNLKLTDDDRIVLLDFGLAKEQSLQTAVSNIAGYTPAYAPLEQIQGAEADARSDVFALAATLYHLLTGVRPIDSLSRATELLSGRPDPLILPETINPQIPPSLASVLLRALALNPAQRPSSAAELRTLLHQAYVAEPTIVPAPMSSAAVRRPAADLQPHPPIAPTPPNNLPAQLTPIIGRATEVASISALLRRADIHLVTLTGPGGSGKTRLALQVASEMLDAASSHPDQSAVDGVFFVSLAPIRDPSLVVAAIAQALGIREADARPISELLRDYLHDKRLLLVLDNFEQVISDAPSVAELLAAPRLKILVTSREALRVRNEREFAVPPLALPDLAQLPSSTELAQNAAVALFVQRARAARPDFALTDANAPAVAEICCRLDGLPLAIELAAARIRILPPHLLLQRLSSRLKLLTGGARDLPARQQTLRSAIDWSYELLDIGERQLFQRLAVFVGGCTLAAAEVVCNSAGYLSIDVLDGLNSLYDKNLLYQQKVAGDEPRLMLLATIWEYAHERLLESGEAFALQEAHGAYYCSLAERAEPELTGPQQAAELDQLELEHDNLRASLERAIEQGAAELALRLAGALYLFWDAHGYLSEGREWMQRTLALSATAPIALRAKVLNGAGVLARDQGDNILAQRFSEESLNLWRSVGDKQGIASSLNNLGLAIRIQGDYAQSRALLDESQGIWREIGDAHGLASVLVSSGRVAYEQGDYARALALLDESLHLWRELGNRRGAATALNVMGIVIRDQGDYTKAITLLQESLNIWRTLGDRWGAVVALNNLGTIALYRGDYRQAATFLEEGLHLVQELGNRQSEITFLTNLGLVALELGEYAQARALSEQSLSLQREMGDKLNSIVSLNNLARAAMFQGDYIQAKALFEEGLSIARELGAAMMIAYLLHNLGDVAQCCDDYIQARAHYRESVILFKDMEDKRGIAYCLEGIAGALGAMRRADRAARLLGAAENMRESIQAPLTPADHTLYESFIAVARSGVDEATFAAEWAAGRAMTLEQTLAYAIEEEA